MLTLIGAAALAGFVWGAPGALPSSSVTTIAMAPKGIFGQEESRQFGQWSLRHSGIEGGTILTLAFRPGDANTVFAGTTLGAFRSDDGGITWAPARNGLQLQSSVGGFAFAAGNPFRTYAATSSHGLFISDDGGDSWLPSNRGVEFIGISSISIDPADPNHLIGAVSGSPPALLVSTNDGQSWQQRNPGLGSGGTITSVVFDPVDSMVIYLSIQAFGGDTQGVAKSVDGGLNFALANNGLGPINSPLAVNELAIDPSNPSRLFAGTDCDGVYRSVDAAASWTQVYNAGCEEVMVIDPDNPMRVIASDGISFTGGDTWTFTSPSGDGATAAAFPPGSTTGIVAGATHAGTFRSDDNGAIWAASRAGLDAGRTQDIAFRDQETAFVVVNQTGIFRSDDRGKSWRSVPSPRNLDYESIAFAPGNPLIGYAGHDDGVAVTSDGGASWVTMNNGIQGVEIEDLAVDPTDASRVFGASSSFQAGGIYRSNDGGANWTKTALPVSINAEVPAVVLDPVDPNVVYAGVGDPDQSPTRMVFKSTDGGDSWSATDPALDTGIGIASLAIDPSNPQVLYAGTLTDGLYKTVNGGSAWVPVPAVTGGVFDIAIDPARPSRVFVDTGQITEDSGANWRIVEPNYPFGRKGTFAAGGTQTIFNTSVFGLFERRLLESRTEVPRVDVNADDRFGEQVVIAGNFVIVGQPGSDTFGPDAGQVVVFQRDGNNLMEVQRLSAPAGETTVNFGASIAIDDRFMVVGAPANTLQNRKGAASLQAAIFERLQQGWSFKAPLNPPGGIGSGAAFGFSVAIDGDHVVVGAPGDAVNGADAGAAFMFTLDAGNVMAVERIEPMTATPGSRFGQAVAMVNDKVAIGAPGSPLNNALAGTVNLFQMIGDNLAQTETIGGQGSADGNEFGAALALTGDILWVGAPGDVNDEGRVYQFDIDGAATMMDVLMAAAPASASRFGAALHTTASQLAAGSPTQPTPRGRVGTSYLFDFDAAGVRLIDPIVPDENVTFLEFGSAVGVLGGNLVIGAPASDDGSGRAVLLSKPEPVFGGGFEG